MFNEQRELEGFDRAWDRQTLTQSEIAAKYRRIRRKKVNVFIILLVLGVGLQIPYFMQQSASRTSVSAPPAVIDKK